MRNLRSVLVPCDLHSEGAHNVDLLLTGPVVRWNCVLDQGRKVFETVVALNGSNTRSCVVELAHMCRSATPRTARIFKIRPDAFHSLSLPVEWVATRTFVKRQLCAVYAKVRSLTVRGFANYVPSPTGEFHYDTAGYTEMYRFDPNVGVWECADGTSVVAKALNHPDRLARVVVLSRYVQYYARLKGVNETTLSHYTWARRTPVEQYNAWKRKRRLRGAPV